jgi:hypothetical protein
MERIDGHNTNLFYGLLDGKLIHISEAVNGLACNCICPACERKLIARNGGSKRIHHYAHKENVICKYGPQTAIHLAAKEILERCRRIVIPGKKQSFGMEPIEISKEMEIKIDSVSIEKKFNDFIPDLIITSGGKRLIVEIAVTHFVNEIKLQKIKKSNIAAIELDLSGVLHDLNSVELEPLIISESERYWLYNPVAEEKIRQLNIEWEKRRSKERRLEEEKMRREAAEEERLRRIKRKQELEEWYKPYYRPIDLTDYCFPVIENCPLKESEGSADLRVSVKDDCYPCKYSRWLREEGKYLVCLFDYHFWKEDDDQ